MSSGPVVFSLQPHGLLAPLCEKLAAEVGQLDRRSFPDGESYLKIGTKVTSRHCIILADLSHPDGKFLPVVFLEGVAAQLFRDQALTVSFSLIAALAVSLTLIPMLAAVSGRHPSAAGLEAPVERGSRLRRIGRAILVGFLGVAVVLRPDFGAISTVAWIALLGGLFAAVAS